jgi:hypothetical protein
MMSRWHWLLAGIVGMAAAWGCAGNASRDNGNGTGPHKPSAEVPGSPQRSTSFKPVVEDGPAAAGVIITPNQEEGVFSGVVRWEGPRDPALKSPIAAGVDSTVIWRSRKVPAEPTPLLQIHGQNGGIAGAVVWLSDPRTREPLHVPPAPVRIHQQKGVYQPHVRAVPQGTRVAFTSDDDNAILDASGAAKFVINRGDLMPRTLEQPGLVELRSKIYPWMSAYVWVFDHNHFATTNEEGRFHLPPVPPGTYELNLWHEGWRGEPPSPGHLHKRIEVKLEAHKGAGVQWVLSSRD